MDTHILELLSTGTLRRIQVELAGYIEDLTRDFVREVQSTGQGLEGGQDHLAMIDHIRDTTAVLVTVIKAIEQKEG